MLRSTVGSPSSTEVTSEVTVAGSPGRGEERPDVGEMDCKLVFGPWSIRAKGTIGDRASARFSDGAGLAFPSPRPRTLMHSGPQIDRSS